MLVQQRTIKKPVSLSGIGLHTGTQCTMTFRPAPENYGIRFRRVDIGGSPEIPADVDHVVDVARGTTLGIGEVRVHTTEHVLAAIVGLLIDNIIIDIDGIEPPIGDGSAKPYVEALHEAGFEMQDSPKDYLVIDQMVEYKDEKRGVHIVALPTDDFRMTVMVDYNNPALGSQHTGIFNLEQEFVPEFSMCRTFCFLHEVEQLREAGLIKGGSLDNAIVIADTDLPDDELRRVADKLGIKESIFLGGHGQPINNKALRFKNEPARHKLLDMLGDLALIGVPLKAHILAARPGHAANVEFAKVVRKLYQQKKIVKKYQHEKKQGVVFDVNALQRILPHRYPFLLVDKIVEFQLNERCVGVKSVSMNEQFFQGHFPGSPVMPGVLIIEGMAQTGGILLLDGSDTNDRLVLFMGINNAKFRRQVVPGDQLVYELTMVNRRSKVCTMRGEAFVDGQLVCEAEMMATIVDRPKMPKS